MFDWKMLKIDKKKFLEESFLYGWMIQKKKFLELRFTVGCQHIPFVALPPDVWTELGRPCGIH